MPKSVSCLFTLQPKPKPDTTTEAHASDMGRMCGVVVGGGQEAEGGPGELTQLEWEEIDEGRPRVGQA